MTITRDEPTSRDYARDAEATRNRLADTLDELHDRLTPGNMLDEMLSYSRGGGATFMRALTNAARENPFPALLIGAGCAMFLAEKTGMVRNFTAGNGRSPSGSDFPRGESDRSSNAGSAGSAIGAASDVVKDQAGSLAAGVRDRAAAVGSTVSGAAQAVGNSVSGAASTVSNTVAGMAAAASDSVSGTAEQARRSMHDGTAKVADAVDQVKEGAVGIGEAVQDFSASMTGQAADAAGRAQQQAGNAARQVKDITTSLMNEQPLLVAAIGVAVGAALAAVLPQSKLENELMGEASDAVKETLGEVASDQYEKAKTAAGSVADHAMARAKEEGLTPSGVAEAAHNIGEKVKRVATEAVDKAGSALEAGGNKPS